MEYDTLKPSVYFFENYVILEYNHYAIYDLGYGVNIHNGDLKIYKHTILDIGEKKNDVGEILINVKISDEQVNEFERLFSNVEVASKNLESWFAFKSSWHQPGGWYQESSKQKFLFVNRVTISGEWLKDDTEELIKKSCIKVARDAYVEILNEVNNSIKSLIDERMKIDREVLK